MLKQWRSVTCIEGSASRFFFLSGRLQAWSSNNLERYKILTIFFVQVLLGFILPTALLSMWISNTASTAMMVNGSIRYSSFDWKSSSTDSHIGGSRCWARTRTQALENNFLPKSLVLLPILELHILKFGILYPANLQEDVIAWHRLCCKYWWDWNSDWDTP